MLDKAPGAFPLNHQLPQGCWIRVLTPHNRAFQPLFPGQAACVAEEPGITVTRNLASVPQG